MKTILHVEDDPIIAHVYRQAMIRAGFTVVGAEDGLIASKTLFKSKPDLVVLDLLMPKLAGADVIKFIRSSAALKDLPVIVLSEAGIADQGVGAAALGADRVLYKHQCTPSVLVGVIREFLAGAAPGAATAATPK